MNKKGLGFEGLLGGAISAGVFFVALAILGLVLTSVGNQSSIKSVYGSATTAVNAESVTVINGTAVAVAHTKVNAGSWAIYNGSNVLGLGNFTLVNTTGTITLKADNTIPQYNNTAVSVNYTYDNSATLLSGDTNATAIINNGKTSMANLSSLGSILVYIIFLVIVIGLFALVGYGAYRALK